LWVTVWLQFVYNYSKTTADNIANNTNADITSPTITIKMF